MVYPYVCVLSARVIIRNLFSKSARLLYLGRSDCDVCAIKNIHVLFTKMFFLLMEIIN